MKLFKFLKPKKDQGYVVPIMGGLGGQILGYALYEFLKKKHGTKAVADGSSLFSSSGYRLAGPGEGLNQHVWNLGYYGIRADSDHGIRQNKGEWSQGFKILHEGESERAKLYSEVIETISADTFPVRKDHRDFIQSTFKNEKLLVVHVRQSDYLNVASKVIRAVDNVELIKKLSAFRPDKTIFVSDGPIDDVELATKTGAKVEVFHSTDYFLVHALLRRADILIAANSQFSLTAALLNPNSLAFFPKDYFGKGHDSLNKYYQHPFQYFFR